LADRGKETVLDYGRDDVNGCDRGRGATPIANANVSCRLTFLVSMTLECWRSIVDSESESVHVGAHGRGYGSLQKLAAHKKKPYPGLSAKDRAWKPVYCSPLPSYVLFVAELSRTATVRLQFSSVLGRLWRLLRIAIV